MKFKNLIWVVALAAAPGMALAANTFTVNSTADAPDVAINSVCADASGHCTLRAAVQEANGNPGPDDIRFDSSIDGTPIVLTLHGSGEDLAATGDLDITDELTITGNGADKTIVDGGAADRVFDVPGNDSLTLQQLTVRNGGNVASGGGIHVRGGMGSLTLDRVTVSDNHASSNVYTSGGGVLDYGDFAVSDSSISDNSAESSADSAVGGGVYLSSTTPVAIVRSRIENNTVVNTASNFATSIGGGLELSVSGSVTLQDSVVTGNQALGGDGQALGGGIDVGSATSGLTVSGSEVSGNSATSTGNHGCFGGGIYAASNVTLIDTTVVGNLAQSPSGGIGGGIEERLGLLTTDNATISGNQANVGAGVVVEVNGSFNLANTLLAGNIASTAYYPDCLVDTGSGATATSLGYNLIGDADDCAVAAAIGDQLGTASSPIDPMLGPLSTGGQTHMLPPLFGSPAIDAGDPYIASGGGTCQDTDQTGTTRPLDGDGDGSARCDIGAVEVPFSDLIFANGFD